MTNSIRTFFVALVLCTLFGATTAAEPIEYPETRRVDHTDNYHGTVVADPYRWLENDVREDLEVANWVAAQNEVTFGYLASIPERPLIANRLKEIWNYERYAAPKEVAGTYYYTKNDGLQNQSVLYSVGSLDGEPKVVIDPNDLNALDPPGDVRGTPEYRRHLAAVLAARVSADLEGGVA